MKYASQGIHPGFETQGRHHQKSKTRFYDIFNASNLMIAGVRSTEGNLVADAAPCRRDRDAEPPTQTSYLQQLPRGKRNH